MSGRDLTTLQGTKMQGLAVAARRHASFLNLNCGLVMTYGDKDLDQHWLRKWLGAWQHQWTMLTYHRQDPMTSDMGWFNRRYFSLESLKLGWKLFILKLLQISQGPMSWTLSLHHSHNMTCNHPEILNPSSLTSHNMTCNHPENPSYLSTQQGMQSRSTWEDDEGEANGHR